MSVSFSLGGVTITVQNPDLDDKLDLDPHQVVQPKASGGFYRFALADAMDMQRELRWSNLRLSELNDLKSFYNATALGTLNTFLFTDERGQNFDAYFLSPTLGPVTVSDESQFPGSFTSGGNTIPTTRRSGGFYELTIKLHLKSPTTFSTEYATTPPPTSAPTGEPTPWHTSPHTAHRTAGPTSPHTAPPEYALESDLLSHEDLTTTAHGGLIPSSAAGANNGVATLDGSGKVPTSQLPATVIGALDYQGAFDCSAGSYPSSPAKGQYWICSVAGTIGGVAYGVGDWLTYNGSSWNRIDNQQTVSSVNSKVGAVTLSASDVGADASGAAAAAQSAAEAASIAAGALVTSVGSPGSDSNVPSEKAVRSAIAGFSSGNVTGPSSATAGHVAEFSDSTGKVLQDGGALGTAAFQNTGAFDAAGSASAAQSAAEAASIPATALVTSVGTPGSDSNVPSEKAVRSALTTATSAAVSAAESASDASGAAATVQGNLNTHTGLTTTAHGGLIPSSAAGANSGVATLDSSGHLTAGQIPTALVGAVSYQGAWDCSTAAYPAMPATGQYWVCSVAGTISGTAYAVGDWLIYNGAAWERLDGSISLANLSGGAETVGGSGGNGTAATAARSDHTHAINSISAATESAAGLMSSSDKAKLDGIASGATALSLANLSGGAETVGGSGGNGTAATAARSDHTHAINSIGEVTESADGLMIATDKAKLDGIASSATNTPLANLGGGSETVGGSASNGSAATAARSDHKHAIAQPAANAGRWAALVAGTDFSAIPASTSTLTMLTNQTANIQPGMALQFVVGGNTYYCQCTATTSSLLTVRGTSLGSSALTSLAYDCLRQTSEVTLNVEAAWTSTGVNLAAGEGHYLTLDLNKSHLIGWRATLGVADTGAAQPYIQPYLNGALVCNSTQMSGATGTFTDGGVWTGDVSLTCGQTIDAQCPTLGTNKTAAKLNLQLVFVQE